MKLSTSHVTVSLKEIAGSRKYSGIAVASAVSMYGLAILVPVLLTAGNSVAYQLSLMEWYNFALIGIFSGLFGLSFTTYRAATEISGGLLSMLESGTGLTGFTGVLFSSPVCLSCLSTILAAVGMGTSAALTLVKHQTKIQLVSVTMLAVSFYFASLNLENAAGDTGG